MVHICLCYTLIVSLFCFSFILHYFYRIQINLCYVSILFDISLFSSLPTYHFVPLRLFKSLDCYRTNSIVLGVASCDLSILRNRFTKICHFRDEIPIIYLNVLSYSCIVSISDCVLGIPGMYCWLKINWKMLVQLIDIK
jgi:hypothetical protein